MTFRVEEKRIELAGMCAVEEAEPLASLLLTDPAMRIDVSRCEWMHAAVAQVLLAFRPPIEGAPQDAFTQYLIGQIGNVE